MFFSGALAFGVTLAIPSQPAYADSHLPIVEIVPTTSFTTTGDGTDSSGGPRNPGATNGYTELDGSITIPVVKNVSIDYSRVSNGVLDSSLSSVSLGGKTIFPGGSRDLLQTYEGTYHFGSFTVKGGFASRYRRCCPADSFEWHKGFLGLDYVTPPIALLNHGFFVLDIRANSSHHYSSPQALASIPQGLSLPNNTTQYTTQQAVTAIIPIDPKHGFSTATTFLWGALDYPVNGPFPYYFDFVILSATKQITPDLSISANVVNVKQRRQGSPFPPPYGINTSALSLLADYHIDFNRFVHHAPAPAPAPSPAGAPPAPTQAAPAPASTLAPSPEPSVKP